MNYDDALKFIHTASLLGSKLGLHNITKLLTKLGSPHDKLKFVHIAGTNGKGTVTKTISEILQCQGYKVGMYSSPFIYKFNERIMINSIEIADDELAEITEIVKEKCDEMVGEGDTHPTEFEIVTAIGMVYFARQKCDYVVLEVGLGGRLDATNAINNPLACVITYIDYDHMEYLGNSLSEIAGEKCGIIKDGAPVISYPDQHRKVFEVIEKVSLERKSTLYKAQRPQITESGLFGSRFTYDGKTFSTKLIGEHMTKNVATALECVKVLKEKGVEISDDAIARGVSQVMWQGRFEIISDNPLFIIDGAHNISGILSLKKTVQHNFTGKKLVFIMGMLKDKEYDESLKQAAPLADTLICCDVPSNRTLPGEILAKYAGKYNKNVLSAGSVENAVKMALSIECDAIIAFGSLYMLGDIKSSLQKLKEEN